MIPLRDANPVRRVPWITLGIIAANVVVFLLWEPTFAGQGKQQTFFFCHAEIPWEVSHQENLVDGGEPARRAIDQQLGGAPAGRAPTGLRTGLGRPQPRGVRGDCRGPRRVPGAVPARPRPDARLLLPDHLGRAPGGRRARRVVRPPALQRGRRARYAGERGGGVLGARRRGWVWRARRVVLLPRRTLVEQDADGVP